MSRGVCLAVPHYPCCPPAAGLFYSHERGAEFPIQADGAVTDWLHCLNCKTVSEREEPADDVECPACRRPRHVLLQRKPKPRKRTKKPVGGASMSKPTKRGDSPAQKPRPK